MTGSYRVSSNSAAAASAGPTTWSERNQPDRRLPPGSASLEVFHSSIFVFVQSIRVSVRTIASRLMYAS